MSAVDRVAGKKTREQLESQVAGIAQSEFCDLCWLRVNAESV